MATDCVALLSTLSDALSAVERPPLAWSVAVAIMFLWINVPIGAIFLTSGRLTDTIAYLDVEWFVAYAGVAIGLMLRRPAARTFGVVLAVVSYGIGLLSGQVISTTFIILIALLLPPTGRAVALWRSWPR